MATIIMFGGNFAPRGWALCEGQLLPISQNSALFSLLGTTYGGDGRTTFGLPDLRGRVPLGNGNGPGLTPRSLGEKGGTENTTLTVTQMPAHTHPITVKVAVSTANGTTDEPNGNVLAGTTADNYAAANAGNGQLGGVSATEGSAGGNQPFNNMQPYQVLNFIIAMQGVFPSRN